MSTDRFPEADYAATPLTEEERWGLIPDHITTRGELIEAENISVTAAEKSAFALKRNVLDEDYLQMLHMAMFRTVWNWAGEYRRSEHRTGVHYWRIAMELRELLVNTRVWLEHKTYGPDEIAARFHHKLCWIRCFPDGNGRHARLAADLLLVSLDQPRFSWGRQGLIDPSQRRQRYADALRAADGHDLQPLLDFVRT